MLSQGRCQSASVEPVSFLLTKSLWQDGLNEMLLPFVLLKLPVRGRERRREEKKGGD
jgi:hypothetical protein